MSQRLRPQHRWPLMQLAAAATHSRSQKAHRRIRPPAGRGWILALDKVERPRQQRLDASRADERSEHGGQVVVSATCRLSHRTDISRRTGAMRDQVHETLPQNGGFGRCHTKQIHVGNTTLTTNLADDSARENAKAADAPIMASSPAPRAEPRACATWQALGPNADWKQ